MCSTSDRTRSNRVDTDQLMTHLFATTDLEDDDGVPLELVHRDVSPHNVLLGAETAGGIPQSIFASGEARWLEIAVRPGASAGSFTNLVPRQPITATPYAVTAGNFTGTVGAVNTLDQLTVTSAAQATFGNTVSGIDALTTDGLGSTAINADITLDARAKNLTVTVKNSGYRKLTQ